MKRMISFSPPDLSETEIANVTEVLRSGWITTGPKTKLFEKKIAEFSGTNKAACLNSATACMELVLRLFGIGPGDEVITTGYTYTATAAVILHVGAKPVLVDVAKDSFFLDYEKIGDAITENTKAIIPVDIAGILCDYDKIFEIINRKKHLFTGVNPYQKALGRILVLSDAAHSFGALKDGARSGTFADFTAFSFHAVKNITTAEGGAVTWRPIDGISDEEIYQHLMMMSLHGQSKDAFTKQKLNAWEYDIRMPGYKCNMTDIMAAIGLGQLSRYSEMLRKREQLVSLYDRLLSREKITVLEHKNSSAHLYMVRLNGKTEEERNRFIADMANLGVACNVHYKPLAMHTAYKNIGFSIADFPNSFEMYQNEVTLPLHTKMTEEDVVYVADCVTALLSK